MKNIICMQGPFSKAFNCALIRELDIKYLVTKCTGKNGGFTEKTEAAKENGVVIDDMTVEVVADGIHVPPTILRLVYKI